MFKGRIEDKFTPILVGKLAEYGCEMTFHKVCDDDPAGITAAILEAKAAGCELSSSPPAQQGFAVYLQQAVAVGDELDLALFRLGAMDVLARGGLVQRRGDFVLVEDAGLFLPRRGYMMERA